MSTRYLLCRQVARNRFAIECFHPSAPCPFIQQYDRKAAQHVASAWRTGRHPQEEPESWFSSGTRQLFAAGIQQVLDGEVVHWDSRAET